MKILWISDPPVSTSSYGQQTALFVPRLRAAGHDVAILATSCGATHHLADGTLVLPVVADRHGNSIVTSHALALNADVVLSLIDPHVLDINVYKDLPWCAWAPLDFETPTKATIRALSAAKHIWSPSKHGAAAYLAAGLKNVTWVPHGVDSTVFTPTPKADARNTFCALTGTEISNNTFLAIAVAANRGSPSRKGFYEMFAAWKLFTDEIPTARLYLHTEVTGLGGVGEDIREIMDLVGLAQDKVVFASQYQLVCGALGPEYLATAYCAADVYLSTSHGEGFGLGALEAEMCGTRVILPRNTAQTELCLTGYNTDVTPYMPFDGATTWGRPNINAIVEALKTAYETAAMPKVTRERVMRYDVDHVFSEHMLPAIEYIAERCVK